jgi:hypothetical protein
VHSLSTTAANVSDITQRPELLRSEESEVFGFLSILSYQHQLAYSPAQSFPSVE